MPARKARESATDKGAVAARVLEAQVQTTGSHPWLHDMERMSVLRSTTQRAGIDPDITRLRNLLQDAHDRLAFFDGEAERLEVEKLKAEEEKADAEEELKTAREDWAQERDRHNRNLKREEECSAELRREIAEIKASEAYARGVLGVTRCTCNDCVDGWVACEGDEGTESRRPCRGCIFGCRNDTALQQIAAVGLRQKLAELHEVEPLALAFTLLCLPELTAEQLAAVNQARGLLGLAPMPVDPTPVEAP